MPQTVTIRTADPGDLARVDALFARAYPRLLKADYPPSVRVLALPIISRARPELLASGRYFVAEAGSGAILGAGGFSLRRGRPGRADVRHVVTDDRVQRRGIGRAIFSELFQAARAAGVNDLDCQATRTAVPFYRAMGFRELGPIEVPLAPGIGFPAILMHRSL